MQHHAILTRRFRFLGRKHTLDRRIRNSRTAPWLVKKIGDIDSNCNTILEGIGVELPPPCGILLFHII